MANGSSKNSLWVLLQVLLGLGGGHYFQNQTFCYNLCIMARISSQVSRNKQRVSAIYTQKACIKACLAHAFLFLYITRSSIISTA